MQDEPSTLQETVNALRAEVQRLQAILVAHDIAFGVEGERRERPRTASLIKAAEDAGHAAARNIADSDFQNMANGHFVEFLRRLRSHPEIIALVAQQPELRVTIERPVIDCEPDSTKGRLARLIHEKFFDAPKAHGHILTEFKRRGWADQANKGGAALLNPARDLAQMGFLTVESDGFRAVPGMKVSVAQR